MKVFPLSLFLLTVSFSLFSGEPESPSRHLVVLRGSPLSTQLRALSKAAHTPERVAAIAERQRRRMDTLLDRLQSEGLVAGEPDYRFRLLLNGFTIRLEPEQAAAIETRPEVEAVIREQTMSSTLSQTTVRTGAVDAWSLRDGAGNHLRGNGVIVAVLDTGIDYTHPDLGGGFGPGHRVAAGWDFVNDDADPMDDHGHGTKVAGVIGASGGVTGMAPEATLWAYKVLASDGTGGDLTIAEAIEHAVDPDGDPLTDDGAHIINLSLTGGGGPDDYFATVIDEATARGVVVVAGAGNGTFSPMGLPAVARTAIAVAALDHDDTLAAYSTRGPSGHFGLKPELGAPGVGVLTTDLGGGTLAQGGTSIASPHVAGAAALVRQRFPDWSAPRIRDFLITSTNPAPNGYFESGAGTLSLAAILDEAPPLIEPPILSFGDLDSAAESVATTATIGLTHTGTEPRAFTAALERDPPEGVTMRVSPEQVTLEPGETIEFTVSLEVDASVAAFTAHPFYTIENHVRLTSEQGVYRVATLARRAAFLRFTTTIAGAHDLLLVNEDGTYREMRPDWVSSDTPVPTKPGKQTLTVVSSSRIEGRLHLWVQDYPVEVIGGETVISHERASFPDELRFELVERDGRSYDFEDLDRSDRVIRFAAETNVGPKYLSFAIGEPPSLIHVGHLEEGTTASVAGYVRRPGRHDLVAYEWFRRGADPVPRTLRVDIADHRPVRWLHPGQVEREAFYSLRMRMGPRYSTVELSLFDWDQRGPYELTTWEPVLAEEIDPMRAAWRELSLNTGGRSERSHAISLTQPDGLVLDQPPWLIEENRFIFGAQPLRPDVGIWPSGESLTVNIQPPRDVHMSSMSAIPVSVQLDRDRETVLTHEATGFHWLSVPNTPGDYRLEERFPIRFRGQREELIVRRGFSLEEGTFPFVQEIHALMLHRNGAWTDRLTGEEELAISFDLLVHHGHVALVSGDDRITLGEIDSSTGSSTFAYPIPELEPGKRYDLVIEVDGDNDGFLEAHYPGIFTAGTTRVIPWVTTNQTWESRIVLVNPSDLPRTAHLTARDREGGVFSKELTLAAGSVLRIDAGDLFPTSGYSLWVSDRTGAIQASFLTQTLRPDRQPSPAQTAAVDLTQPTNEVHFAHLEAAEIPAIVLLAPNRTRPDDLDRETDVTLTLHGTDGSTRNREVTLIGARPLAITLSDLFPDTPLPEDAWLTAKAGDSTHLIGTAFTFNHALEAAMAPAESRLYEQGAWHLPWVVANETWATEISFHNLDENAILEARARTKEGQVVTREIHILPEQTVSYHAGDLFPGINGYSLTVEASNANLAIGARTVNRLTPSGGSPSQMMATRSAETGPRLLFGYLPTDRVPALVVTAPNTAGPVPIRLTALGPDGVVAETMVTLDGDVPIAELVGALFPGTELPVDTAVIVEAIGGQALAGTAFTFNEDGEPSMARAVAF